MEEKPVIVSREDVIRLLRQGKENYFGNEARDGCCARSKEYVCNEMVAITLSDQLQRYTEASLTGLKRVEGSVSLLTLNEGPFPVELNYALVWVDVGYPKNGINERFLDDLFYGLDIIARGFDLVEG